MTEPVEQEITTWRDSWTGHKRFNLKEPSIHRTPGLSIVIPLYNELLNLDQLLEECVTAGESLGIPWELILVDDGSTDGSQQYLKDKVTDTVRVLAFAFNSTSPGATVKETSLTARVSPKKRNNLRSSIITCGRDIEQSRYIDKAIITSTVKRSVQESP